MGSNINARKIDNERMRNCALCDCVSTSCASPDMYELTSYAFKANSVSEKPRLYLCEDCIKGIANL